jgi:hypothetical protein
VAAGGDGDGEIGGTGGFTSIAVAAAPGWSGVGVGWSGNGVGWVGNGTGANAVGATGVGVGVAGAAVGAGGADTGRTTGGRVNTASAARAVAVSTSSASSEPLPGWRRIRLTASDRSATPGCDPVASSAVVSVASIKVCPNPRPSARTARDAAADVEFEAAAGFEAELIDGADRLADRVETGLTTPPSASAP